MKKNPKVSVVVPLFNKREQVVSMLESVFQQSFTDFEVIVVDDGSTDGSEEQINSFLNDVRYFRQENAGPSSARNKGIELALGEYIAFLDADDSWKPAKLHHQMEFLNANPSIQWCATNYFVNDSGTININFDDGDGWTVTDNWFDAHLCGLREQMSVTSGMVVRREILERVGMFDLEIRAGQDFDLWIRIAQIAPSYAFSSIPLWTYNKTPDSVSEASPAKFDSVTSLYEKHIELCLKVHNKSYQRFVQTRSIDFIKRTVSHGMPEFSQRLFRVLPREWKSLRVRLLWLLSQLPIRAQKLACNAYRLAKK